MEIVGTAAVEAITVAAATGVGGAGVKVGIDVGSGVGVEVDKSRKGNGSSVGAPSITDEGVAEMKMICGSLIGSGVAEAQAVRSITKSRNRNFTHPIITWAGRWAHLK